MTSNSEGVAKPRRADPCKHAFTSYLNDPSALPKDPSSVLKHTETKHKDAFSNIHFQVAYQLLHATAHAKKSKPEPLTVDDASKKATTASMRLKKQDQVPKFFEGCKSPSVKTAVAVFMLSGLKNKSRRDYILHLHDGLDDKSRTVKDVIESCQNTKNFNHVLHTYDEQVPTNDENKYHAFMLDLIALADKVRSGHLARLAFDINADKYIELVEALGDAIGRFGIEPLVERYYNMAVAPVDMEFERKKFDDRFNEGTCRRNVLKKLIEDYKHKVRGSSKHKRKYHKTTKTNLIDDVVYFYYHSGDRNHPLLEAPQILYCKDNKNDRLFWLNIYKLCGFEIQDVQSPEHTIEIMDFQSCAIDVLSVDGVSTSAMAWPDRIALLSIVKYFPIEVKQATGRELSQLTGYITYEYRDASGRRHREHAFFPQIKKKKKKVEVV